MRRRDPLAHRSHKIRLDAGRGTSSGRGARCAPRARHRGAPARPRRLGESRDGGTRIFTGLIEHTGIVRTVTNDSGAHKLTVENAALSAAQPPGASINVNGACLTVVAARD